MELRKIKKLLELYMIPILVGLLSVVLFFNFFNYINFLSGADLSNFKVQLLATFLGVFLSISIASSSNDRRQYLRLKRTFGLLKLIAVPHLKNQAENIKDTMDSFSDICTLERALSFLVMSSQFDSFSTSSDKNWMQLIYSKEFLDAPINDAHFNTIASAILEQLLFTKKLVSQASNAKGLIGNPAQMSEEQKTLIIKRSQEIRDDLRSSADSLLRYVENLNKEVISFLEKNGAHYSETER